MHVKPHGQKWPLLKTFWQRFWFKHHILSRDGCVAFDSLLSEKVTNTRIANLQQLQPFRCVFLDVFCLWVRDFYSRGKLQSGTHIVLYDLYVARHMCSVLFF